MLTLICPHYPALQRWRLSWQEAMPPSPPRHAPPQQAGARHFCSTHWPLGKKSKEKGRIRDGVRERAIKTSQWGTGGWRTILRKSLWDISFVIIVMYLSMVLILRILISNNNVYIPKNDIHYYTSTPKLANLTLQPKRLRWPDCE